MAFDATLLLQLAANYSSATAYDFQSPVAPIPYGKQMAFTNGAGLNQADRIFADRRVLNASTNDDLDLAGGLTDAFGATITLARVKGIIVSSAIANAQNFTVGAGSNPLINWISGTTPAIIMRPGGTFMTIAPDATGFAVTAATGDILRIANGAGVAITYDIVIIGASS